MTGRRLAPTIEAACLLDELALERNWSRDDRDAVEARCSAWAENNERACFNIADVRFIVSTRCEALPRRSPAPAELEEARGWLLDCFDDREAIEELEPAGLVAAVERHYEGGWAAFAAASSSLVDPEYADVDEAGQLALGVTGEQRAIPGLARARTTTTEED